MRLIRGWSERKPMTLTNREGKLWITFYHQSKRYRKSLGLDDTKANRKLALNSIIPEIQYKLNSGEFFNTSNENKVPTVGEFAKVSFSLHKGTRKSSTQYDYEIAFRLHIEPHFGTLLINAIKPSHIASWQSTLLEKLSPRRVRSIRATFNTIFEDALRDEIIDKNPIAKVKTPKLEKIESKSFSLQEIKTILEKAKGDIKNFCALGFYTGMRSGEMIGLKWSDIDFEKREISIKRAIKMGVTSTPKTQNSIRTIDIIDALMPYLKTQYSLTGKQDSYVFLNDENSHYYDVKRLRNTKWKKLLIECNIPYRTIYQMRHTFATVMIENGEDVLWVSSMLGHADPSMTLTMYAKYRKRVEKQRATFLMSA